jgi:hypothetical protein
VSEIERFTPGQVVEQTGWVQDLMRAALVKGVDYDTMPGWRQPDLLKPGAEKLLFAARLTSSTTMVDDDESREHRGVRYVCSVATQDGVLLARREGYAGYDETRFAKDRDDGTVWRADWNNVIQMAQKRALVAATKGALMASGLFAEGADDTPDPGRGSRRRRGDDRPPPDYYDNLPEATGTPDRGYRYDPNLGARFTD